MTIFSSQRIVRAFFAAAVLVLPVSAASCGRTACFQWTAAEGSCPAQDEAMQFFHEPKCPGAVVTVDSEGSFDGELCCYAVTQEEIAFDFFDTPCVGSGAGGFGGSNNVGSSVVVGAGGALPSPGCFQCGDTLFGGVTALDLCSFSLELFDALFSCSCVPDGACTNICAGDLCGGAGFVGDACFSCLSESPECAVQLDECINDFGDFE